MKAETNFLMLLQMCREHNPSSLTSRAENAEEKIMSAVHYGLDLVPRDWRGKRVLILGCGDGYEVQHARESLGWQAHGITFHPEEYQARVVDSSLMTLGDLHGMPFEDESFDCVYSKETLEHVACPMLALIEINRVLRMEGQCFHLIADGWNKQRDWYHLSCFPDWLWADLFRKAYLDVDSITAWPNCDRASFENKGYHCVKTNHRAILEPVQDFKRVLGFGGF